MSIKIKGYIPVKIKKYRPLGHVYNDKIWYCKDNVIVNKIPNEINPGTTEATKNYDLQFLDHKLFIKE